jgi:hypothetical protein
MSNELKRIRKKAVIDDMNVQSNRFHGGTEEKMMTINQDNWSMG